MNLTFDLILPFKLPIKDENKIVSSYGDANFLFMFNSYKKTTVKE